MSVRPPLTEVPTTLRTAKMANAQDGGACLHAAIQALILALLACLLGHRGAARCLHRAGLHVASPSPWFVGSAARPAARTAGLLRLLATCLTIPEDHDPDAPIPRPLRRGSPDIIIAQAHALPPRDPARPAPAAPPRTRPARDPPAIPGACPNERARSTPDRAPRNHAD